MTTQEKVKKIMDKIYAAYGSDSGVLFGIKDTKTVKAIIRFTVQEIEEDESK